MSEVFYMISLVVMAILLKVEIVPTGGSVRKYTSVSAFWQEVIGRIPCGFTW